MFLPLYTGWGENADPRDVLIIRYIGICMQLRTLPLHARVQELVHLEPWINNTLSASLRTHPSNAPLHTCVNEISYFWNAPQKNKKIKKSEIRTPSQN